MSRFHCISTALKTNPGEPLAVKMETLSHVNGVEHLCKGFNIAPEDWPDGYGISNETVTLSTHQGTHIDAPLHYHPGGDDIASLDVNDFIGKAVVFKDEGGNKQYLSVDADTYTNRLIKYAGEANAIIFITGAYEYNGEERYFKDFKGVPVEMIKEALDMGYKVMGTDAFSLDPPFEYMSKKYIESGDSKSLWPAHVLGRKYPYYQIERLGNLERFESAKIVEYISLPVKLHSGASWTRAVARIIE